MPFQSEIIAVVEKKAKEYYPPFVYSVGGKKHMETHFQIENENNF